MKAVPTQYSAHKLRNKNKTVTKTEAGFLSTGAMLPKPNKPSPRCPGVRRSRCTNARKAGRRPGQRGLCVLWGERREPSGAKCAGGKLPNHTTAQRNPAGTSDHSLTGEEWIHGPRDTGPPGIKSRRTGSQPREATTRTAGQGQRPWVREPTWGLTAHEPPEEPTQGLRRAGPLPPLRRITPQGLRRVGSG